MGIIVSYTWINIVLIDKYDRTPVRLLSYHKSIVTSHMILLYVGVNLRDLLHSTVGYFLLSFTVFSFFLSNIMTVIYRSEWLCNY